MLNKILHGDCLKLMKDIPDKSIDMILCDLPYGTTACKWDVIIPFNLLWEQYKRIIKNDGTIVLTASQPFTSLLVTSNINWFSHCWIWEKNNASNFQLVKKQPLKISEDVLIFNKPDNYDLEAFKELKNIFKNILNEIGISKKKIIDKLGQGLDHCFRFNSLQWGLPTEKNYLKLIEEYNLINLPTYDILLKMYSSEFKSRDKVYHPQGIIKLEKGKIQSNKGKAGSLGHLSSENKRDNYIQEYSNYPKNIIKFDRPNKPLHPTQKPVALFEYLIKTYTNEDDVVLDNCAGSGTTAIACINTNRNYILMEQEHKYFNIINERIKNHTRQKSLF